MLVSDRKVKLYGSQSHQPLCLPDKGEVKSDWQLKVQLYCSTLVVAANGIFNLNVNLKNKKLQTFTTVQDTSMPL